MDEDLDINTLFNNPIDYVVWLTFFKKREDGLTKYMKSFQLFTSFDEYKNLANFKPDRYGASDDELISEIYQYDQKLILLEEEEYKAECDDFDEEEISDLSIDSESEKFRLIRKIILPNDIRKNLDDIYIKLRNYNKIKIEFDLLKSLAILTDEFTIDEITAFCYRIFPDLTINSKIKGRILLIPEKNIRNLGFRFFSTIPSKFCVEFIKNTLKQLIYLSLIQDNLKSNLNYIVTSIIETKEIKIILNEIKESFIILIEEEIHDNYKIILRNIIDYLIKNQEQSIEYDEKSILLKYLLFFIEYNDTELKNYYKSIKNSKFGLNLIGK